MVVGPTWALFGCWAWWWVPSERGVGAGGGDGAELGTKWVVGVDWEWGGGWRWWWVPSGHGVGAGDAGGSTWALVGCWTWRWVPPGHGGDTLGRPLTGCHHVPPERGTRTSPGGGPPGCLVVPGPAAGWVLTPATLGCQASTARSTPTTAPATPASTACARTASGATTASASPASRVGVGCPRGPSGARGGVWGGLVALRVPPRGCHPWEGTWSHVWCQCAHGCPFRGAVAPTRLCLGLRCWVPTLGALDGCSW